MGTTGSSRPRAKHLLICCLLGCSASAASVDAIRGEPNEAEETTAGGIVLPDSAKEKPQRGTVVAVGPGRLLDSGNRGEMSISNGDTVIYGRYGGSDIEVDGKEMKILRESDILAKVL